MTLAPLLRVDFPRPRGLFEARVEYPRRLKEDFWLGTPSGTPSGTLVVTRQDLSAKGNLLTPGPVRTLARIPGMQSEDESGTVPMRLRVSPDGTRLALTCGQGYFQVVRGTDVGGVPRTGPGKDAPSRHPVFILDAKSGRTLNRAVFERVADYSWSPNSRRLAILALDRNYQRSTVYVLGGDDRRRLVRRDAVQALWADDCLITAKWRSEKGMMPYGDVFQASASTLSKRTPVLMRHGGRPPQSVSVNEAERLLGVRGAGPSLWAAGFARDTLQPPGGRGLLLVGGPELLPSYLQTNPDDTGRIDFSVGPTESVDEVFQEGKRYLIRHPGQKLGDGGTGVERAWNIGRGMYAYSSSGDSFVKGDGERARLAAIHLPSRTRRYWYGVNPGDALNTEIVWR